MKLSKEQQKAAHTDSKKVLVLAGAGSGKSRTLVGRVEYLIKEKNISPYEIMCITFTRLAANELVEKLNETIGSAAYNITTGTIHGMALNYLQRFGELAGLTPGKITIYSQWESDFLLKEVAKDIGYHTGKAWKKVKKGEVDAAFNLFYTTGAINPEWVEVNLLMNAFFARCRENNALTYGTILTTFKKIIPEIYEYLPLFHIMVDEVQDNDPLQWEIINQLCKYTGADLFAVGDIRQSIFSFRGADPEYLIRNQNQFDLYNLKDNYRSSATIVEAANRLISHNHLSMGEPMEAMRDLGRKIEVVEDMDSDRISGLCAFYQNSNCAVLSRIHGLLKKLSRLLDEAGIKHEYIGKKSGLVKSEEFRRFHSFLKLIVNPFDNFSFLLIKDYLGLSAEEYGEIRLKAVQNSISHFRVWQDANMGGIGSTWIEWFVNSETGDFHTVIDWLKDVEWGFDPEEIFNFVYSWMIEHPASSIDQYLNWVATFDVSDETKDESPGLKLMTIHAAKGLEFSTVIIAGMNDGIFPDSRSAKENDLVSELRLAYVALTRSKDQLILTSRPVKKDKSGRPSGEASRFIEWSLK